MINIQEQDLDQQFIEQKLNEQLVDVYYQTELDAALEQSDGMYIAIIAYHGLKYLSTYSLEQAKDYIRLHTKDYIEREVILKALDKLPAYFTSAILHQGIGGGIVAILHI